MTEEKATRLEIELPKKVAEEFKRKNNFKNVAEEFLFDKIWEFYEILSNQIQGVDPDFPFGKIKIMSYFL